MINKLFGEILREFRTNANLSQEKLAELSSLDRTYISLLERGKRQPTLQTLFILHDRKNECKLYWHDPHSYRKTLLLKFRLGTIMRVLSVAPFHYELSVRFLYWQ